jgi:signal transduction histidine kinase
MTRLYLRIFLYFWLVIGLALVITLVANRAGNRADLERERVATLRSSLDALAAQAQGELVAGGEPALRTWLERELAERPEPALLVLGPDDADLLGRPLPRVPSRFFDLLRRAGDRPAGARRGPFPARVLTAGDGTRYLLFVPSPEFRRSRWLADPLARRNLWVALLLASGAICFVLAWQVTRPVRALREAGGRIAGGDLSARVGPAVGRRRDELGALAREFDRMADRVQALVGSQQQLLRDVSHELRSPLARLQVAVGLLRQRAGDAPDPDLDRLETEAGRLDALIDQVLALSRLQACQEPARTPLDLATVVAEVVADAGYEARAAGRQVLLAPAGAVPFTGDEALLRSAIDNVVRNAIEHCRSTVRVAVGPGPPVTITIVDDGPGVPAADLNRLFEPFFQVPGRAGRGSGLGLAIAARAVSLHGGTVEAGAAAPAGLVVTLRLPA